METKTKARLVANGSAIIINYDKQQILLSTGLGRTRTGCRISFTDGIPENVLKRIWDRFIQIYDQGSFTAPDYAGMTHEAKMQAVVAIANDVRSFHEFAAALEKLRQ